MIKISVIVPVYNGEKYLLECLQSIQKQTFSDWECICVNDGSKDESLSILRGIAQKDTRFRVISQPNGGVTSARRNGVEHATGEYISFVDCDDLLPPDSLEILMKRKEEYDVEIVIGSWMTTTDKLESIASGPLLSIPLVMSGTEALQYTYRFGCLWRSLIPLKYISPDIWPDTEVKVGEDALTLFALLLKVKKVLLIPDCVYLYRMQDQSATHTVQKDLEHQSKIYFDFLVELDKFIKTHRNKNLAQLQMLITDIIFHKFSNRIIKNNRKLLISLYIRHFVFSLGCQKIYWKFSWKNWAWMWIAGCKFFYNSSK